MTGALQEKDEFAQQVGITQAMHLIELPVRLPAVMHQDGNPFGQNPVSLDRFPATPGVDPYHVWVGGVTAANATFPDPQTRFVGMRHRRFVRSRSNTG